MGASAGEQEGAAGGASSALHIQWPIVSVSFSCMTSPRVFTEKTSALWIPSQVKFIS